MIQIIIILAHISHLLLVKIQAKLVISACAVHIAHKFRSVVSLNESETCYKREESALVMLDE